MTRPVAAYIDVSALRHNFRKARTYAPNSEVMAVVKANAYGHGLATACRAFSDADIFGMLDAEEAVDLRQSGFSQRICLLEGFFTADEIAFLAKYRLEPVIHSTWQIDQLEKNPATGPLTIWLKVDSGMNRLGFSADEARFILLMIREHLRLGFYSDHLPLSPRLVFRYVRNLGEATPLAVLHSLADCAAALGPRNTGALDEHLQAAAEILEHYYAQDAVAAPPVLLDGHAIMELLGIPPGPRVGELKDALLEATAAGEVETVAQAEEFLQAAQSKLG